MTVGSYKFGFTTSTFLSRRDDYYKDMKHFQIDKAAPHSAVTTCI